jgi:hypothetical protein
MATAPHQSLPKQCNSWGDLKAAYGVLHHPKVRPDQIQSRHRQRVGQACRSRSLILAVQDTTELDFTTRSAVAGLGPIGDGRGRGLLQHSTLALTPEGALLGVLHQIWRTRVPAPEGETRRQRRDRPKESDFWHESVEAVGSLGPGTRLVHVVDRGGDDFSMMVSCLNHDLGFLARAQHDRCLNGNADKLWSYLQGRPVAGHRDIPVPARKGQPARVARLTIRFATVQLEPPKGDPRFKQPLGVWAVYVIEANPPAGAKPVEWMLITSEPVNAFEDACQRVDWYCRRWVIEEWHKAEKTGCRLEASQLKDAEAIQCLAALVAVVAVRLIQLRDLAQMAADPATDDPQSPAHRPEALQAVVPGSWLLAVAHLAKCRPESLTPRVFWLTIAKRGGFIGRKSDGRPGWQTIWRGWYDVMMMVQGIEIRNALPDEGTYG